MILPHVKISVAALAPMDLLRATLLPPPPLPRDTLKVNAKLRNLMLKISVSEVDSLLAYVTPLA